MNLGRTTVSLGLLAVATAACLRPPRHADEGTVIRLSVWGMPFEDTLFRDRYARDFEANHPGLNVRYERYAEVSEKYLAWHMLGRGADVMRMEIKDYHDYVARGMLLPLTPFFADPEIGLTAADRADFIPALWDALELDGVHYAIPSDNAQYGLYYNPALFDAYNAGHPDAPLSQPGPDWTWDDLRRAAEALTIRGDDGRTLQYGVDFDVWAWPFLAFLAQAGGAPWDETELQTTIDSPAGLASLELIVELLPHAGRLRAADVTDSATGPDKLFAAGRTAILLDGSWRAPFLELVNPDLDFRIVSLPRGELHAIVGNSVLWAISAHTEHPRLAWELIHRMTSPAGSQEYWQTLRVAPPARRSVILDPAFRQTPRIVAEDGTVLAPGLPLERWTARGAWLLAAITPDERGQAPGFVISAPYQKDLEAKINAMLSRAIAPGGRERLPEILRETADAVHAVIDRDRAARGLPAAARSTPGS